MSFSRSGQLSLAARLRERIGRAGAISFRDWMAAALYDPVAGYYCRGDRQRWGREGDYRTSPERGPLFAATFARYFASLYEKLGRPASWTIVEFGAGAGDFALGVLQTLQLRFPDVFAATSYVIDELSENSRSAAQAKLLEFGERVEFSLFANLAAIRVGLIFSNELLDAFPVHRVKLQDGELREFYVTLGDDGKFAWITSTPSTPRLCEYLEFLGVRLKEGQIAEINLGVEDWLTEIAARIESGYVITVDYGAESSELYGAVGRDQGTLRAFRRHQFVEDVLASPGDQDLTTTIDWSLVKKLGERTGLETVTFERQDRFLLQSGCVEELEAQMTGLENEAARLRLSTGSRELLLPTGMAASFQLLVQKKTVHREP